MIRSTTKRIGQLLQSAEGMCHDASSSYAPIQLRASCNRERSEEHCLSCSDLRRDYDINQLTHPETGKPLTGRGIDIYIITADCDPRDILDGGDMRTFCNSCNLSWDDIKTTRIQFLRDTTAGSTSGSGAKPNVDLVRTWKPELVMDIQAVLCFAPEARIWVVVIGGTSVDELAATVARIDTHVRTSAENVNRFGILSLSLGTQEKNARAYRAMDNMASAVLLCLVASGDDGVTAVGDECDFPACHPHALSVGGAHCLESSNTEHDQDAVWEGSGGGMSLYYTEDAALARIIEQRDPDHYAANIRSVRDPFRRLMLKSTKPRVTPDISADGAVDSGMRVFVNGRWVGQGGTSLATPLMAAYFALVYQAILESRAFASTADARKVLWETIELRKLLYLAPAECFRVLDSDPRDKSDSQKWPHETPGFYRNTTGRGEVIGPVLFAYLYKEAQKKYLCQRDKVSP